MPEDREHFTPSTGPITNEDQPAPNLSMTKCTHCGSREDDRVSMLGGYCKACADSRSLWGHWPLGLAEIKIKPEGPEFVRDNSRVLALVEFGVTPELDTAVRAYLQEAEAFTRLRDREARITDLETDLELANSELAKLRAQV